MKDLSSSNFLNANERKHGWSNSRRNMYYFIQCFERNCLSSSGCKPYFVTLRWSKAVPFEISDKIINIRFTAGLISFAFSHLYTQQPFLCLVLVEHKAKCYRAYVCVRNTCCSCNMSWSVPHLTFWSTKSRITRVRNPLLLYRVVIADDTIFHITRHM